MSETTAAGDYTLDSRILRVLAWSWASGGSTYRPRRVSLNDILRLRSNTSTGTPQAYTVVGSNLLMVYPTPAAADVLTIYYVPRPSQLVSPTDTPSEIPAEFHKAVEYYALQQAADYDDDSSSAQGQRYGDLFEAQLAKARKAVQTRGGPLPRRTVDRPSGRLISRNNSQYP